MSGEVCPYCRTTIGAEDQPLRCEGCGTPHHADCYAENSGCTIFGCSKAPGDEPKLRVSVPELVAAATPAAATANRVAAPMPPPPPPGGTVSSAATTEELRHVASGVVPSIFGGFENAGTASAAPEPAVLPPKSRTTYILLGALLGAFGAHSFYAGYSKKGGIQLGITLLTLGFASPMSWMWAVIDICTINCDSRGVQFES